jgi:hypothetical protein
MAFVVVVMRFISFESLALKIAVKVAASFMMLLFIIILNKAKLKMLFARLKRKNNFN